jgi:hypothetical protein
MGLDTFSWKSRKPFWWIYGAGEIASRVDRGREQCGHGTELQYGIKELLIVHGVVYYFTALSHILGKQTTWR